jgi:hypothetical protein
VGVIISDMPAKQLILSAPYSRYKGTGETFDEMVSSGLGPGYIFSANDVKQLTPGCTVVHLDKDKERRAESKFKKLVIAAKAGNGQQRYDVYFENAKAVPYKSETLRRNSGVAVI